MQQRRTIQERGRGTSVGGGRGQVADATDLVIEAHALCEEGAFATAERTARKALAVRPGFATARVALGRALVGLGRYDEAQAVLIETAHAHPGYAAAYRWLAEAFMKAGDEVRGRGFLAEAMQRPVNDPALDDCIVRETGEVVIPGPLRDEDLEPTAPFDLAAQARALSRRAEPSVPAGPPPAAPAPLRLGEPTAPARPALPPAALAGPRVSPRIVVRVPARRARGWRKLLAILSAAVLGAAGTAASFAWRRAQPRQELRLPQRRTPSLLRAALRPFTGARASAPAPQLRMPEPASRTQALPPADAAAARARLARRDAPPRPEGKGRRRRPQEG